MEINILGKTIGELPQTSTLQDVITFSKFPKNAQEGDTYSDNGLTFIKEKNGWVVGNTTLPEVEITAKKEKEKDIEIFDIIPKSPKITEKITEIAKNKDEKTPEQVFDDIKYVFLSVGIGITALALQNFRVWLNTPAGLGLKILIKSLTGTDIEKLAQIAEKKIQETDKSSPETDKKPQNLKMEGKNGGNSNPYFKMSESQLKKSYKSYQDLIEEHTKKLDEWLKNPDAYDNKNILKNNPQHRDKIIQGRAMELQRQIDKQKGELNKIIKVAQELNFSLD